MAQRDKFCFIICPLGDEGSRIRTQCDNVERHIIRPVIAKSGYVILRADTLGKPGIITNQIIEHLVNDKLVVADLTNHNPNVMYELAIRHTVKKPVIQMIQIGQKIPFDVVRVRTVFYDLSDLDALDQARRELSKQVQEAESPSFQADNPVITTVDLHNLRRTDKQLNEHLIKLAEDLKDLRSTVPWSRLDGCPNAFLTSLGKIITGLDLELEHLRGIVSSSGPEVEEIRTQLSRSLLVFEYLLRELKRSITVKSHIQYAMQGERVMRW